MVREHIIQKVFQKSNTFVGGGFFKPNQQIKATIYRYDVETYKAFNSLYQLQLIYGTTLVKYYIIQGR